MTKPLVIYHKGCSDGIGAAWCFWSQFKDNMEYHAGIYNEAPPDILNRDVYLVDFSYKRDIVDMMCKYAAKVTLIDHHKTALEDLAGLDKKYSNFDMSPSNLANSGCVLAWNYVKKLIQHKDKMPELLKHIEDRDLWKFEIPGTKKIMMAVFSYELTFENIDRMMKLSKSEIEKQLFMEGLTLDRKYQTDLAKVTKSATRKFTLGNWTVPVCNCNSIFASDAGNLLAKDNPFAATYYDTETKRIFSLRSTETGIDVSEVAKMFGGGGHKHAAGFDVDRNHALAKF